MPQLTLKTPPKAKGESDVDYESKLVSAVIGCKMLHYIQFV